MSPYLRFTRSCPCIVTSNAFGIFGMIIVLTFATELTGVTRNASFITVTSLFVTWRVVETVSAKVVHTIISMGPVIALCKHIFPTNTFQLSDLW